MMYVHSKLANGVMFHYHGERVNGAVAPIQKSVEIKGGAGVRSQILLLTPQVVTTPIIDEIYAWLKDHVTFKHFVKEGMMVATNSPEKEEKMVKNMGKKDKGAQKTAEDFPENTPKTE